MSMALSLYADPGDRAYAAMALGAALGGDLHAVIARLGDSIEEMIRHSARSNTCSSTEGLPELSAHAYQFLQRTQFVIGFRPKEDWPMRELQ
jgi:hypothetical protein